jgi:hypothetical protein
MKVTLMTMRQNAINRAAALERSTVTFSVNPELGKPEHLFPIMTFKAISSPTMV